MKIKLLQIRDALEDVNMNSSCYFNKKTNEILWLCDDNCEYSTYSEDDEYNDNIITMFHFFIKNDYDIMQNFVDVIDNIPLKNKLYNATSGKGAFGRFRNIVDENNLTNEWYKLIVPNS